MPGRRCCAPLPPPPLVGRGRAFADTSQGTGGKDRVSFKQVSCNQGGGKWALPGWDVIEFTKMALTWYITCLYCCSSSPALLWTSVMITPGLMRKKKAAELGTFSNIHLQIVCQHTRRLLLTTQSSPSLAYLPVLKWINLHFNYLCQCVWCRTCSIREKQLAHRVLYSVWTDRWQTWTCSKPAHQGTTGRKTPGRRSQKHTNNKNKWPAA